MCGNRKPRKEEPTSQRDPNLANGDVQPKKATIPATARAGPTIQASRSDLRRLLYTRPSNPQETSFTRTKAPPVIIKPRRDTTSVSPSSGGAAGGAEAPGVSGPPGTAEAPIADSAGAADSRRPRDGSQFQLRRPDLVRERHSACYWP